MARRMKSIIGILLFSISFCAIGGCVQKNEVTESPKEEIISESENEEIKETLESTEGETEETQEDLQVGATTLFYQGHASVRIVTVEGKVIYIDPFMGEGYDLPADLILETHNHYDHTKEDMIKERNEDCTVIKWSDALTRDGYQTFDLGYVTVEGVEAGYNTNHSKSVCVGFILTFSDGTKVYFSGDTSTTPSMAGFSERELDYAFLCCDGVFNMNTEEASECAKAINAKHSIPYHVETAKDDTGFDESVAETFDGPGRIIIKPGEKLELKHE